MAVADPAGPAPTTRTSKRSMRSILGARPWEVTGLQLPTPQGFPSGQRGRAVNPLAQPSEVRILLPAPSVRLSLRFGKHVGHGRLSPEQQSVVDRLERDEITAEEAQKLLGGHVRVFDVTIGEAEDAGEAPPEPAPAEPSAEPTEDEIARALVERIAQDVDAESRG